MRMQEIPQRYGEKRLRMGNAIPQQAHTKRNADYKTQKIHPLTILITLLTNLVTHEKRILSHLSASESSKVGKEGTPELPPSRNGENCSRKLAVTSRVYTFGDEGEITERFNKKLWKSQFYIENLVKKSHDFLKFSVISSFLGKVLNAGFLIFSSSWKIFIKCWFSWNFLQIPIDFLQNFQNLHDVANSPRSEQFIELFDKNISTK